ncbi:hypothetical protein [Methylorubrum thiocyanatum]
MLNCFRANLNNEVSGGWKSITDGNGLLATASDRIALLDLLSWVRPHLVKDLRLLKSIRNRFAHHADVNSFDDNKILGWISSLEQYEQLADALWPASQRADWRKLKPRELYLVRASCVVMYLVNDLAVGPAARQFRVAPGHIENIGWENLPESLREVHSLLAEFVGSYYPPR